MLLSRGGTSLLIWSVVFTVFITVVVAFRCWAACIKRRILRPDDYLIFLAYISTLILEALTWWGIANGLGAHTADLDRHELGVQYQLLLGGGITWLFATIFCKLSILWFYTCIFAIRVFKITAWILMFVVTGYGIAFVCVFLTTCHPISYVDDPIPSGSCTSVPVSLNMVIDTVVVILPLPPLWRLQMATRNKVAITFLFSLGLLVVALMAWRIQLTVKPEQKEDFVHEMGILGLVTLLEVWIGIIVACIPTLTPLLTKYWSPLVSKLARKGSVKKQLREAQHTIGSDGSRNFTKKNFNRLDKDASLFELEECRTFSNAEATGGARVPGEQDGLWMNDPTVIGVRHAFQVYDEPQKR